MEVTEDVVVAVIVTEDDIVGVNKIAVGVVEATDAAQVAAEATVRMADTVEVVVGVVVARSVD